MQTKAGDRVPRPTSPSAALTSESVVAPGRILKESRPVGRVADERIVSLPATSQIWGSQPAEPSCSRRRAGVSSSTVWISVAGALVFKPRSPSAVTKSFSPAV